MGIMLKIKERMKKAKRMMRGRRGNGRRKVRTAKTSRKSTSGC